jgi:excisionase family DNA binding protein
MSKRDPADANLDELCALADARYYAWHAWAVQPEREALFAALKKQKVSSGRELKALRIVQEQLVRAARKRISIYRSVAREHARPEMLSVARLDNLADRVMRSVGAPLSSLRSCTRRAASAMGVPHSSLLHDRRYDDARAAVHSVVNTALAALRSDGKVREGTALAPRLPEPAKTPTGSASALQAKNTSNVQPAALDSPKAGRSRLKPNPAVLPEQGTASKRVAAAALGVSIRTIERMVRSGELPQQMVRDKVRFKASDLREILERKTAAKRARQTATK